MDEQKFRTYADAALERLFRKLSLASDTYGFDADFNNGTLTVEFEEPPGKFVVSPNSPVRQIWVSALTKSFKLDWSDAANAFTLPASGQTLDALMAEVIGKQLNGTVQL